MIVAGRKRCPRCGESKLARDFSASRHTSDGLHSQCRACNNERSRVWKQANPEKAKAGYRRWSEANRERRRVRKAVERSGAGQSGGEILTVESWLAVLDAFDRRCCYCRSQDDLSLDHLTPVSRGGGAVVGNVAPACRPCNCSKHARLVEEFRPDLAADIRRRASLAGRREGTTPPADALPQSDGCEPKQIGAGAGRFSLGQFSWVKTWPLFRRARQD
jgi:5-methylcytosine-specific restriction endonuclease McrA